jgi:glucose/mannose-6-phosphate isomerase
MINQNYYGDIKKFPSQILSGFKMGRELENIPEFKNIVICGMGGSSMHTELLSDYLQSINSKVSIIASRGYSLPSTVDENTLVVLGSYSGSTEETLECLEEVKAKRYKSVVFSAGGKLVEKAKESNISIFLIPKDCQPRLSTGYIIGGMLGILTQSNLINNIESELEKLTTQMDKVLDEDSAKKLATLAKGRVLLFYTTDNCASLGRIAKIKCNETAKIPSFWNVIPECIHNEMVGFTTDLMSPFFCFFKSKFTHQRNQKRIELFSGLMSEKGYETKIVELNGESQLEELLNAYYFIDHLSYYCAKMYGNDPEPLELVDIFKSRLG